MDWELIKQLTDIILNRTGPNRVLVSAEGDALPWRKAHELGIEADIIFIRLDGWSLGAPSALEVDAFALWPREWVAFIRRGSHEPRMMTNYVPATTPTQP